MATPARFFSTLAQATGIILGFIIALATAIYQIKRSQIQSRLNRFREDITDYEQEYRDVVDDMATELRQIGSFEFETDLYQQDEEPIEVVQKVSEWAEKQDTPRIAKLWICLRWWDRQISVLHGGSDLEYLREQMTMTERPVLHIISEFEDMENPENPREERLFFEIVDQQGFSCDEYNPEYNVFGSSDSIDYWLRRNTTKTEGYTFESWRLIADNLTTDYYTIDGRKHLSGDIFEHDELRTLLVDAGLLFSVGVLIPMLFLITIPPTVPLISEFRITGVGIPLIEIAVLLSILVASAKTLRDVVRIIG